ncbi:MAG: M28 family peptidase [Caulobacter sp.]|nr:M28 family peptidase [Caulobacter sp.]
MRLFLAVAAAAALLATSPALAAPPASTAQEVAGFAAPTAQGRLEALKALLDNRGIPYELQSFTSAKGPGVNVVVTLGKGDRDILLTAHYDAKVLKDGKLADAVVDNAASVVALVHAAGELKGGLKNHRLRIVFFDQEELGLLGAHAYAGGPDAGRAAAVINFDINAYGDTPFFSVGEGEAQATILSAMAKACKAVKQDCLGFEKYPPSDHLAFRKVGILATSISILPRDEALALDGFMAAPQAAAAPPRILGLIHTPDDTMASVDPTTVEQAARLAVAAAKAFDAR